LENPMKLSAKDFIIQTVNEKAPIKATELAYIVTVAGCEGECFQMSGEAVLELFDKMVNDGDLVEVNYILPTMDYREKTLYFPKDTQVRIGAYEIEATVSNANPQFRTKR
jgi:hypothetical protein